MNAKVIIIEDMKKGKVKKKFFLSPNEKRALQKVFAKDGVELPERTLSDAINFVWDSEQAREIRSYVRNVMGIKPRKYDVGLE